MQRIGTSDPRWKTASTGKKAALGSALKKKLLARLKDIAHWAPYRGTTQQAAEISKVFAEFMQDVESLGYQAKIRSTGASGPSFDLITLPLLAAMETGIEENLGKFIEQAFGKVQFVDTESVFRMFAQDLAEEMLNYVQNHTSGTSAKPRIRVVEDDVQIDLQVEEGVMTDRQYEEIERVLTEMTRAFARKHDIKMESSGIDYSRGDLTFSVFFAED